MSRRFEEPTARTPSLDWLAAPIVTPSQSPRRRPPLASAALFVAVFLAGLACGIIITTG